MNWLAILVAAILMSLSPLALGHVEPRPASSSVHHRHPKPSPSPQPTPNCAVGQPVPVIGPGGPYYQCVRPQL